MFRPILAIFRYLISLMAERRLVRPVAIIAFWGLGFYLGPINPAPLFAAEELPALVIVHTSDVHGQALEERDPKSGTMTNLGYARLKSYFQNLPTKNKLLLDAGDSLHGQPLAMVRQGEFIALILKSLNYDALAVGNHDFDYGLPRLMELRDGFGLNFLAANIIEKEDGMPLLPPWLVKDFDGLKVGLFALTTPDTPQKTDPANVESISFGRPDEVLEQARRITEKLRQDEGVELVVALTHLGSGPLDRPGAQALARGVPGLNLIIDGHSHARLTGLREGETIIVSSGAFLENLGQITVHRSPEGGLVLASKLIPAEEMENVPPDPELSALLERLSSETNQELSQVLGRIPFGLDGRREQIRFASTNLGRLVCAAVKSATGADAAILNSGSIRDSIPAGEITRKQLLTVLPYANYAVTVRLTGAELLAALNSGLAQPGEGAFPQFYGMAVTAQETGTPAPDGRIIRRNRADLVEIGGRPLDLESEYTIAVNDFMYVGGDGYQVLGRFPAREYGTVMEIVQNFLASASPETLAAIDSDDLLTIIVEE